MSELQGEILVNTICGAIMRRSIFAQILTTDIP